MKIIIHLRRAILSRGVLLAGFVGEEVLRLAPGTEVTVVDSGCCGMAGQFGYERGHYEVSMKMGERRLFPAVRGAKESVVIAPGTSCREQVLGGTGRRAQHPAVYLANRLDGHT